MSLARLVGWIIVVSAALQALQLQEWVVVVAIGFLILERWIRAPRAG